MMNPRRIVVALCAAVFKSPEPEEFLVEIQNMVIYPYYNRNKQDDIAVIKLKRTIKFDGYHLAKARCGCNFWRVYMKIMLIYTPLGGGSCCFPRSVDGSKAASLWDVCVG